MPYYHFLRHAFNAWVLLLSVLFLFLSAIQGQDSLSISKQALNQSLHQHIPYTSEGPNFVGYISIGKDESINQSTWLYVKNALEEYKKTKPIFIILELNTPGGEVFAAQKISDALKEMDILFNIPIVAYINNWAISAGAMLAYSCRYITVVKDASMGAAEPVNQSGGKLESASEKVNSAMRSDFAARASFFDRNPLIAEAMVDADVILVLRAGKIIKLDDVKSIEPHDEVISSKGKLLTLNSMDMMRLGVADILLEPSRLQPITPSEKAEGKWPASKELLFEYPFFKVIPQASIDSYQMDWKTRFFVILASPIVSSLLFLGLIIGLYMELNTPGFGLAGTIAFLCLVLIILSSFAQAATNWLEIIILIIGISLLLLEIFVIPGFGIPGILGIILTLFGLFAILLPSIKDVRFEFDTKTFNAAGYYFLERLAWLSGTLVVGVFIIAILAKYFVPRFGLFKRFVLKGEQEAQLGYVSAESTHLPKVGSIGIVAAPLRPSGKAIIESEIYDVISRGSFIEKDKKIKIVALEGSKIVVEELIE